MYLVLRPATGCVRESRVCSRFLANQQTGWEKPRGHDLRNCARAVQVEIMNELRRFVELDNHEEAKIGDLEAIKKPKFNRGVFPKAIIRKGVSELTLRENEKGTLRSFVDAPGVWVPADDGPPLVHEEWHAKPPTRAFRQRNG